MQETEETSRPVQNVVLTTKGLQERNTQVLDGTIVKNCKLILFEIKIMQITGPKKGMGSEGGFTMRNISLYRSPNIPKIRTSIKDMNTRSVHSMKYCLLERERERERENIT
jgi:hypothetical protein